MRERVSRSGMKTVDGAGSAIQSVARAAQILGFFTVGRPRRSLSEITARLGVSKATAHRYTVALRQASLVRRVNETVVLSIWDGEQPVVVRVDDNPDRIVRLSIHTGARLTAFQSSQ